MREVWLSTRKFDGSRHYHMPVYLVHADELSVAVFMPAGTMMDSYRGYIATLKHHLIFYWLDDRHHDLCVLWHSDWRPAMHYINIATPAQWDGRTITHADMDLDVYRRANEPEIHLDDEDEFIEHSAKWDYPPHLIARCRAEVDQVTARLAEAEGLFGPDVFDWRPGTPSTGSLITECLAGAAAGIHA